jgi:hypothetical protein
MQLPRLLAFAAILLALAAVPAPAGSAPTATGTCGLARHIQDADIRARFERFDLTQSAAAAKVCAYFRNEMAAAHTSF